MSDENKVKSPPQADPNPEDKEPKDKKDGEAKPESKADPEPESKPKEQPSSSKISDSAEQLKHLNELVGLIAEKLDRTHDLAKQTKEDFQETNQELRETTQLLQALTGDVDHVLQGLGKATAALVKLHQEQSKKA